MSGPIAQSSPQIHPDEARLPAGAAAARAPLTSMRHHAVRQHGPDGSFRTEGARMFGWLGQFVVRRAWWVIGGWIAAAAIIMATAPSLSDITSADQGSFLPSQVRVRTGDRAGREAFPQQTTSTAHHRRQALGRAAAHPCRRGEGRPGRAGPQGQEHPAHVGVSDRAARRWRRTGRSRSSTSGSRRTRLTTRHCSTRYADLRADVGPSAGRQRSDRRRRRRRGEFRRQRGHVQQRLRHRRRARPSC